MPDKKPLKPYKFFIDSDPVAYAGAASAQSPVYTWIQYDSNGTEIQRSEGFYKAVDAKAWIGSECWEDEPEDDGWIREVTTEYKTLQDAYDATDEVMKDYKRTANKFCRKGKDPVLAGWLTPSGLKDKDIKGLEDQYQFNRIGKERPRYLKECRSYLLSAYPWIKMARQGFEADTHVVGRAESAGDDGCTMSIDKDIAQAQQTWNINMYDGFNDRKCKYAEDLGELWQQLTIRGKSKTKGDGFMFLCYQALVGDVSDGYKGLMGVGDKAALKALLPCTTKIECVQALEKLYKQKAKKGYLCKKLKEFPDDFEPIEGLFQYMSWDDEPQTRTVHEMMQQHFSLAYQERSPYDVFDINDYLETDVVIRKPQPKHPDIVRREKQEAERHAIEL